MPFGAHFPPKFCIVCSTFSKEGPRGEEGRKGEGEAAFHHGGSAGWEACRLQPGGIRSAGTDHRDPESGPDGAFGEWTHAPEQDLNSRRRHGSGCGGKHAGRVIVGYCAWRDWWRALVKAKLTMCTLAATFLGVYGDQDSLIIENSQTVLLLVGVGGLVRVLLSKF